MQPLIRAEQFLAVLPSSVILPEGGDEARIETALRQATGIIVSHLPWLIGRDGEIARPVNPQFADTLEAVCADVALDRLTDAFTGSENARNKYKESLALLEKINREHQGGLEGPGFHESEVVVSGEGGIEDGRFFKKGRVF